MKEKIGKMILSFFVVMICCTLVARGADSVTVARVQTTTFKNGSLTRSFSGTGKLQAKNKSFQFLPENQKVAGILARPGNMVEAGQPLVQLDKDYLQAQISDKNREIQKMKLQIEQQKLNGQTAARLPATAQAELSLNAAREARNKAREVFHQAEEAYNSYINSPEYKAALESPEAPPSGDSGTDNPGGTSGGSGTGNPGGTSGGSGTDNPGGTSGGSGTDNPGGASGGSGTGTPGGSDAARTDNVSGQAGTARPERASSDSGTARTDNVSGNTPGLPLIRPHTASLVASAPGSAGEAAQQKKQELQQQMDAAREQMDAAQDAYDQTKETYRLAEQEEQNARTNEARQTQSSRLTLQGLSLDLEELEEDLARLTAVQSADGIVTAETSGILESIGVSEGTITAGTEPLVVASTELEACGEIPAGEIGNVKAGDEVEVRITGYGKSVALSIERLEAGQEGAMFWFAPYTGAGNPVSGTAFAYDYSQKSAASYDQLIPLSALYESAGSFYVLTAEVRSGILGDSYTAVKVPVTLLEKDDLYAAVQTSLGRDALIITSSSKYVKEGDRVRLNE